LADISGAEAKKEVAALLSTITPPTDAAVRVFAITELLENILLQLAASAVETGDPTALEPLALLARLHLVDRTFNTTLKGSAKLIHIMYYGNETGLTCRRLQVGWLLYGHLGVTFEVTVLDGTDVPYVLEDHQDGDLHEDRTPDCFVGDGPDDRGIMIKLVLAATDHFHQAHRYPRFPTLKTFDFQHRQPAGIVAPYESASRRFNEDQRYTLRGDDSTLR
jgi:hypothetical protein